MQVDDAEVELQRWRALTMLVSMQALLYIYIYICLYTGLCACACACARACVCVCVCVYPLIYSCAWSPTLEVQSVRHAHIISVVLWSCIHG